VQVSQGLDISSFGLLAELQEESITTLHSTAGSRVALGTAKGMVAILQQLDGNWELAGCRQLDGSVCLLGARPDGSGLLAATEASTLW
jgi:hypothetical protein